MTNTENPGNCPQCNAFDDDLDYRGGICEACYQEHNGTGSCPVDDCILPVEHNYNETAHIGPND